MVKDVLKILKSHAGKEIPVKFVLDYIHKIAFMVYNLPNAKAFVKGYCLALLMQKIERNKDYKMDKKTLCIFN